MGRYIAINITRNEKCVQGQSGTPTDSTVTQLLSNGGHRHPDPCFWHCKGTDIFRKNKL